MSITLDMLESINRALNRPVEKTVLQPVSGERLDKNASQNNKPSPVSSFSDKDLLRAARKTGLKDVVFLTVQNTNSMEPFVDAGDIVFLELLSAERIKKSPLRVGLDVCTYSLNGMLVLHRVVEERKRNGKVEYRFKGDNNFLSDGWVDSSFVRHRLIGVWWGSKPVSD